MAQLEEHPSRTRQSQSAITIKKRDCKMAHGALQRRTHVRNITCLGQHGTWNTSSRWQVACASRSIVGIMFCSTTSSLWKRVLRSLKYHFATIFTTICGQPIFIVSRNDFQKVPMFLFLLDLASTKPPAIPTGRVSFDNLCAAASWY